MALQEKINYEFQCFYLDQMRTSKENIFAHSEEIEIKKKLSMQLQCLAETVDEETAAFLMMQNNLLESVYCFWKDVGQKNDTGNLTETVKAWQKFLKQKGRGLRKELSK